MKKMCLILVFCLLAVTAACGSTVNTTQETPALTEKTTASPTILATQSPTPDPTEKPAPTPKGDNSGGIISTNPVDALLYDKETEEGNKRMAYSMTDAPVAIQFYATTAFNAISLTCHSGADNFGTVVFGLYEWKDSYEETLLQEKLAAKTFEDYSDNASLKMEMTEALADGEYLLVITTPDSSEGVGVWYANGEPYPAQHVFFEEMYVDYAAVVFFKICYTQTPKHLYGPLSDPE